MLLKREKEGERERERERERKTRRHKRGGGGKEKLTFRSLLPPHPPKKNKTLSKNENTVAAATLAGG